MSIKIYTNFFLSSTGCNLKISFLKNKMKQTWIVSSYLAEQWVHCNMSITFGTEGQNAMKNQ